MASYLTSAARRLGGEIMGRDSILCPGPGHSRADRSLRVWLSSTDPNSISVHSYSNDSWDDCKDHVRAVLGLERPEWKRRQALGRPGERTDLVPVGNEVDPDEARITRAVAVWRETQHGAGTIVDAHFASRGLTVSWDAIGSAIRFHPACPWRCEATGRTIFVPAMIAALTSIANGEITGVHRTRLSPDGRKVDRRMLGKASGTAIMLTPYTAIGAGLAIGEGVETCLAGMQMGWSPAWAMGSVGAIERFPLLPGLQSLILFCENDDSGANERAVNTVAERYAADGREVVLVEPKCVGDLNDALRSAAA